MVSVNAKTSLGTKQADIETKVSPQLQLYAENEPILGVQWSVYELKGSMRIESKISRALISNSR